MVAVLSVRIMYCLQLVGKLSVPTIRRPGGSLHFDYKLERGLDERGLDAALLRHWNRKSQLTASEAAVTPLAVSQYLP